MQQDANPLAAQNNVCHNTVAYNGCDFLSHDTFFSANRKSSIKAMGFAWKLPANYKNFKSIYFNFINDNFAGRMSDDKNQKTGEE